MTAVAVLLAAAVLSGLSGSTPALARYDPASPGAPAADRIGPEFQLSIDVSPGDSDRFQPAVAYNSTRGEYLVVWHKTWVGGGRGIYAGSVTRTGKLGAWFVLSTGAGDRAEPALAYNWQDEEYLVVWMHDVSGDDTRWAIKGKIIPWYGAGSNPEFTIADDVAVSSQEPSVVYNYQRREYLVIWNTWGVGPAPRTPTSVARRRVKADGTMPLAGVIHTTDGFPHQSDIAYNDHEDVYLMAWVRVSAPPPGGTGNDIWADWLGYQIDGSLMGGAPFSVTHSTKNENHPAVATNSYDRYIVVFEYEDSATDRDIYGQQFDWAGFEVGVSPFQIASTTRDETFPDVWAAPGTGADYFAAWQRTEGTDPNTYQSIWARRMGSGVSDHYFQVTPWAWDNRMPAVAGDWWGGHLIAYAGKPFLGTAGPEAGPKRHIYGRIWWTEAVFVPLVLKGE